jgi:hypothetical protein
MCGQISGQAAAATQIGQWFSTNKASPEIFGHTRHIALSASDLRESVQFFTQRTLGTNELAIVGNVWPPDHRWRLAKAGRSIWRVAVLSGPEVIGRLEERPSKVGACPATQDRNRFGCKIRAGFETVTCPCLRSCTRTGESDESRRMVAAALMIIQARSYN